MMLGALYSTNAGDKQFIQNFNCKSLKRWHHLTDSDLIQIQCVGVN